VKFCLHIGEPPSKPKYIKKFDSERVPWGKGEKALAMECEIELEI